LKEAEHDNNERKHLHLIKHDECDELKSGLYAGEFKDQLYYTDFPT
jgi:hypothetical protein